MPLSVIASSILVFFGSSLGAADHPLVLTLIIPLFGGAVMLMGGWLFIQGVRKKDPIEEVS